MTNEDKEYELYYEKTLDIDTKIIAWDNYDKEYCRYFSHFDKKGQIFVFKDGGTSWSTKEVETFENWRLAEEDKK